MKFDDILVLLEDDDSIREKLNRATVAAETQRGVPENTMLEVVHNLYKIPCPQIIKWGLEHYGDLSHRAQQMRQSVSNLQEKLTQSFSRSIAEKEGVWTAKEEIEKNLADDLIYTIIQDKNYPIPEHLNMSQKYQYVRDKYYDAVLKKKREIVPRIVSELEKYIKSHQIYNLPVTLMGRRGKAFAILFAQYCIAVLQHDPVQKTILNKLQTLQKNMLEWIDEFNQLTWNSKEKDLKFLEGYAEN